MSRGRLPETDEETCEETCEDIRAHWPSDQAEAHIRVYYRLRASGMTPPDAAMRTMTKALDTARRQLAGELRRN